MKYLPLMATMIMMVTLRCVVMTSRMRWVREVVRPRRYHLVRMQQILGIDCYYDNIQDCGSRGVWEGEGRSFCYSVTFIRNGKTEKRKQRTEELITGCYKLGVN